VRCKNPVTAGHKHDGDDSAESSVHKTADAELCAEADDSERALDQEESAWTNHLSSHPAPSDRFARLPETGSEMRVSNEGVE